MNKKVATVGALVVLVAGFLVFSAWEKEKNIITLHENPNVYLEKKPDGLWIFRVYDDVTLKKKSDSVQEDVAVSGVHRGMKLSDNPNAKYYFDAELMKTYVFQQDGSISMCEIRPNEVAMTWYVTQQSRPKAK